jgi:hypothetical protein
VTLFATLPFILTGMRRRWELFCDRGGCRDDRGRSGSAISSSSACGWQPTDRGSSAWARSGS